MGNPGIREIVKVWLEANGCDGLMHSYYCCECKLDELMACEEPEADCIPGYLKEYKDGECPCGEGCSWHIQAERES
jgi:hypothetical protein